MTCVSKFVFNNPRKRFAFIVFYDFFINSVNSSLFLTVDVTGYLCRLTLCSKYIIQILPVKYQKHLASRCCKSYTRFIQLLFQLSQAATYFSSTSIALLFLFYTAFKKLLHILTNGTTIKQLYLNEKLSAREYSESCTSLRGYICNYSDV